MENSTQLFLGVRFNCNKCHDHPFDQWTQMEYFEMLAFTGGIIMGRRGIQQAYTTGRGHVRVRARYHVEEKGQKEVLVVTEIPYQVKKTTIIDKIVEVLDLAPTVLDLLGEQAPLAEPDGAP